MTCRLSYLVAVTQGSCLLCSCAGVAADYVIMFKGMTLGACKPSLRQAVRGPYPLLSQAGTAIHRRFAGRGSLRHYSLHHTARRTRVVSIAQLPKSTLNHHDLHKSRLERQPRDETHSRSRGIYKRASLHRDTAALPPLPPRSSRHTDMQT